MTGDRPSQLAENAVSHAAYFTIRASEELRANRPQNAQSYASLAGTFRRIARRHASRVLPSELAAIDALGREIERQRPRSRRHTR